MQESPNISNPSFIDEAENDEEFENDLKMFELRLTQHNSSEKPKLKPNISPGWIDKIMQE